MENLRFGIERGHWLDQKKYNAVLGQDGHVYNAHPHHGLNKVDIWVPVHSTGKTDKNGVELFDGDICKHGSGIDIIEWEKHFHAWGIGNHLLCNAHGQLEKVGSKLENPELMDTK